MSEEYLECRIILFWIENKANLSCRNKECNCPAISAIAHDARSPASRKELLKGAPGFVKERYNKMYDFETGRMKSE